MANWLDAIRRYLAFLALTDFAWEIAQLPLYTIWATGTPREIAVAVIHCTAGDVIIGAVALIAALSVAGEREWPRTAFARVAIIAIALGLGYTIFSEWLNIVVRRSWAYSTLMPVVPLVGTGLSPLAQWILVPGAAMWRIARMARPAVPLGAKP